MNTERFKKLLDELDGNSLETLKEKNPKYAKKGDCLYNFKVGAELMNCTTAQACWNYMSKHLAELWGKIETNDFSNREDFLEKCQDTINYIRFLWCIGNDGVESGETTVSLSSDDKYWWFSPVILSRTEYYNFIDEMNRVRLEHGGVISVATVYRYAGYDHDGPEDYHQGWYSTEDWLMKSDPTGTHIQILIPNPVNI